MYVLQLKTMTKKSTEKNIRKITKVGGHSYAVILPMSLIKEWKWKERQRVVLEADNKKKTIKIKDWPCPSEAHKSEGGKKK